MRKLLIMLMVGLFAWTVAHTACAGSLVREEVRGQWRFCYYDVGGEIEVLRVHSSGSCPSTN